MHHAYLREIIETGGAPSIEELAMRADNLGGYGYHEESAVKKAFNAVSSLVSDKVGDGKPA